MAKALSILDKRKLILSVGDEGAILTLVNGQKLIERHFFENPQALGFAKTLHNYANVPLYLLADVLDQAYIQHALPPVSSLNIGQLVKRRLEKDFANEDIKAARRLSRDTEGRKDWNYSFISVHNAPPFSEWLDACAEAENPFKGIYLLPIETEVLIKKINHSLDKKIKKSPEWQILVSHNKVGGFRQIVYRDGKVIFTRIAQPIGGQSPDVLAGNIEQETLNTIEYVRRLGFDSDENLEIFIIASRSVKSALETNALRAKTILIMSPDEVAERVGIKGDIEKTDRFGDVVIAASFAMSRAVLKFQSPTTRNLEQIMQMNLATTLSAAIIIPALIIMSIISTFNISETKEKIFIEEEKQSIAKRKLNDVISERGELPENSDQIIEIVDVYDHLSKDAMFPLDFVKNFAEIRGNQLTVDELELTTEEFFNVGTVINASFKLLISNPSNNIDQMLEDIDNITLVIREKFKDYNVTFTGLPSQTETLSLDAESQASASSRTLDVTIEGPISNIPQKRSRRRRR